MQTAPLRSREGARSQNSDPRQRIRIFATSSASPACVLYPPLLFNRTWNGGEYERTHSILPAKENFVSKPLPKAPQRDSSVAQSSTSKVPGLLDAARSSV